MLRKNRLKVTIAALAAVTLQSVLQAQIPQIPVVSSPTFGQVTMGIGSGGYAPSWNTYGPSPEHAASFFMPSKYTTSCNGKGFVGRAYVSGEMGCGPYQDRASVGGNYRMGLYAPVVPGSKVRVRVRSNMEINWNGLGQENSVYYTFASTGTSVNRMSQSALISGTIAKNEEVSATVTPNAYTARLIEGQTMYYLGTVDLYGRTVLYNVNTRADYAGSITNVSAHYIGRVLTKSTDTDNQTGLVNEALPKPLAVKVLNGETGLPAPGAPITFWLANPGSGAKFSNGGTSMIVNTDASGVASAALTLGPSTGTYLINASCPATVCTSGVREAAFTATANDKALKCVSCEWSGVPAKELPTPFRFRVLDEINQQPVSGVPVSYSVVSFTDKDGNTINQPNPRNSSIRPLNAETDIYGFSRAYLTLGTEEGTYVVRARCETCVSGQEQIAYGVARSRHVEIKAEKTTAADPEDTPIVQITQVLPPNDGKSFTTADGENYVALQARLLGEEDQSLIRWTVEDDPHDFIFSGTPQLQYANGPVSGFTVRVEPAGGVPKAETGRARPLGYKIHAGADVPGKVVVSQRRTVRQDEIDKCRQEYIDWDNGDLGKQLAYAPRSKFVQGLAGDFGRYRDCYANIYPTQEAQVAFNLINAGHSLDITSGYRSPRHNMLTVRSSTSSPHLFGDAVDIVPADDSPAGWQALWESPEATCPKVLEYNKRDTILFCGSDGIIYEGKAFPLTGAESKDDPRVFSIQKNCIHLGELKH